MVEEGLESMWARHKTASEDLWAGLRQMGLEPFPDKPEDRLATVNTIKASASFMHVPRQSYSLYRLPDGSTGS